MLEEDGRLISTMAHCQYAPNTEREGLKFFAITPSQIS